MPNRYNKALAAGIKPDPLITYTEWADSKFELPKESSSEYGRYRSSRTPVVRDVLDDLSPMSPTEIIVVVKPTQYAGTTIAIIFLCGIADLYPGPAMCMMPTDTLAKSFSKKKLSTTIKLIPSLNEKIKDPRSRDSGNTILQKDFPGGSWMFTGSNSAASYRSESIKYLVLDDFDGFELDIEGEGAPEELADRRTGTFAGRKIYINSTTTVKGSSNIERAFESTSQGYFHVPCPHCGRYQYLIWGKPDGPGVKFTHDETGAVVDVWYQCECCQKRIDEHEKPWMAENGAYIHKYPERKAHGYRWNALTTPLGWINSWSYIAEKFLIAQADLKKGNIEKYKTWLNSFMAEPWEQKGDRDGKEIRRLRDGRPSRLVPSEGVLGLTAGIDTQDNGFWFVVRAWGKDLESWLIHYGFIDTFPGVEGITLKAAYEDVNGQRYPVLFTLQDAMGHRTKEVYDFTRQRDGIIATQGVDRMAALHTVSKIDTYPGTNKAIPGGVKLLRINTTAFKNHLSSKIQIDPNDPGAFHLHSEVRADYTQQMTAEFINKKGVWECPPNKPNHLWDCETLALVAADFIGVANFAETTAQASRPRSQNRPVAHRRTSGRTINPKYRGR